MGKYLDIARKFEARRAEEALEAEQVAAAERAAIREEEPSSPFWPCRHCGQPAEIESVEPRKADGVLLTFWRCLPCQIWAVTPSTLKEPPVWVSKAEQ